MGVSWPARLDAYIPTAITADDGRRYGISTVAKLGRNPRAVRSDVVRHVARAVRDDVDRTDGDSKNAASKLRDTAVRTSSIFKLRLSW